MKEAHEKLPVSETRMHAQFDLETSLTAQDLDEVQTQTKRIDDGTSQGQVRHGSRDLFKGSVSGILNGSLSAFWVLGQVSGDSLSAKLGRVLFFGVRGAGP